MVRIKESNLATPTNVDEKAEKRKSILNKFKNLPLPEPNTYDSFDSLTPTPMRVERTDSGISKPIITLGIATADISNRFEKDLDDWGIE